MEDACLKKYDKKSQYCIELLGTGDYSVSFFEYSQKFFEAVHVAAEYILNSGQIGILDNYFFPVAYMYRHSLELILKAIASELRSEPPMPLALRGKRGCRVIGFLTKTMEDVMKLLKSRMKTDGFYAILNL